MRYLCFTLLCANIALAQSTTGAAVTNTASYSTLIEVDVSQRGDQIYHTFQELPPAVGANYPEWIFQTNLPSSLTTQSGGYSYITNGRIPFVQAITPTVHNTLLIITYKGLSAANVQYIVVPAEQIQELIYVPLQYNQPQNMLPFTSTPAPNTTPYYALNPQHRMADIISAVNTLKAAPFARGPSQVWLMSSISGPFFPALSSYNAPGLVENVLSIEQLTNGLIKINYQPRIQTSPQVLIAAPEQILQIFYVPFPNTPLQPR